MFKRAQQSKKEFLIRHFTLIMLLIAIIAIIAGCGSNDRSQQGTSQAGIEVDNHAIDKNYTPLDTTATTIHPGDIEDDLTIIINNKLTSEAKDCMASIEGNLQAKGIPVLSVSTRAADGGAAKQVRESSKETDILPLVAVRIPASAFLVGSDANYNYLAVSKQIERELAGAATYGTPIIIYAIVTVDVDSAKEETVNMGLMQDLVFAPEWKDPARTDLAQTETIAKDAASEACSKANYSINGFIFSEDSYGRILELKVTGNSGNPGVLHDSLYLAIQKLNADEGTKISSIYITATDSSGAIVALSTYDFAMGTQAFWSDQDSNSDKVEMLPDFLK